MIMSVCTFSLSGCNRSGTADVEVAPEDNVQINSNPTKIPDSGLHGKQDWDSSNIELDSDIHDAEIITIGFVQVGHESAWREAATESALDTFSRDNGYELMFIDSDNDSDYQKQAAMQFIEQKIDYLIIDPIVTGGWDNVLKAAKEAGVKVFVIDRTIDCDESMYEAWFGSDFEAEGEAAGAWLEAYLKDKGREKEDISIVTVAGTKGSAARKGRTKGFSKYIKKNDNWTKLAEKDGEFTKESGKRIMEEFIIKYGKIDVVVCHNDNEAWGAMEALDEAGITYGMGGDTILISFDAVYESLEYVLSGKINADFECNPLSAPYIEDAIRRIESGRNVVSKTNYIDEACFQAENNVYTIEYAGRTSKMITVTEQVLKSRAY